MERQEGYRSIRGEGGRPLPGFRLFNAVLFVRWMALAFASVAYASNLVVPQQRFGDFIPVAAAAIVYNLGMSVLAERAYASLTRSSLLLVIDYGFSFAAFVLTGDVWSPLLAFCAGSFLLAGLRGSMKTGMLAGLALVAVYVASLYSKGLDFSTIEASGDLSLVSVYAVEFLVFSVVWAYAAGLLSRVEVACEAVRDGHDALARANRSLQEKQDELAAVRFIRRTILGKLDREEMLEIVLETLKGLGFARCRVWLFEGAVLTAFPPGEDASHVAAGSADPVAVAVRRREALEFGPDVREPERFLGAGAGTFGVVVPILAEERCSGPWWPRGTREGRSAAERSRCWSSSPTR